MKKDRKSFSFKESLEKLNPLLIFGILVVVLILLIVGMYWLTTKDESPSHRVAVEHLETIISDNQSDSQKTEDEKSLLDLDDNISENFTVNSKGVLFWFSKKIYDNADPATIKIFYEKEGFTLLIDKNNVYLVKKTERPAIIVLDFIDAVSFEYMYEDLFKDKNKIYRIDGSYDYNVLTYDSIDDVHIRFENNSDKDRKSSYYHRDGEVYYRYLGTGFSVIENADFNTFEILSYKYAKDKNHLYYEGRILYLANPNNYSIRNANYLSSDIFDYYYSTCVAKADLDNLTLIGGYYYRGEHAIYYINEMVADGYYICLENADLETFEKVETDNGTYYRDRNHIFVDETQVIGADRDSFELLPGRFAKDKNYGYEALYYECYGVCLFHRIEGSDGETFEVVDLKHYLTRDKNNAYYYKSVIEDANPKTIHYVSGNPDWMYFADDNHVYLGYDEVMRKVVKLQNIDADSFTVDSFNIVSDKNGKYEVIIENEANSVYLNEID